MSAYWYRKAADQGLAEAQSSLGGRYYTGKGVPQSYPQAAYWWSKAAAGGNHWAKSDLERLVKEGHIRRINDIPNSPLPPPSIAHYDSSAPSVSQKPYRPTAQQTAKDIAAFDLARDAMQRGDKEEALRLMQPLAARGNKDAIAILEQFGTPESGAQDARDLQVLLEASKAIIARDNPKTIRLLTPLAKRGNESAIMILVNLKAWDGPMPNTKNFKKMQKSNQGIKQAGEDYFKAQDDLAAAAKADNYQTAWALYQPEADKGVAGAQYNVGMMYDQGMGVPKSAVKAAIWYGKAAKQGISIAQYRLGLLYAGRHGVSQSHVQSFKWQHMAAEQGHAEAQVNVALMYVRSKGVEASNDEAVKWFRKAATQGNEQGKEALKILGLE